MIAKRILLAALLLLAGFAAGWAWARPTASPIPVAESAAPSASDAPPTRRAIKSELSDVRAQLAICLAYRVRASAESPSSTPTPKPPEWDEETARLVQTGTTSADTVRVRMADGSTRSYPPGAWPPPDGPPDGSRIVSRSRRIDGGVEMIDADGGVRALIDGPLSALFGPACPCPRDAGSAGSAGP